jgi:hypothetical protein
MVAGVLQWLFSDLQPRQREEKWLGPEPWPRTVSFCIDRPRSPLRRQYLSWNDPVTAELRPHPAAEIYAADVGALIWGA